MSKRHITATLEEWFVPINVPRAIIGRIGNQNPVRFIEGHRVLTSNRVDMSQKLRKGSVVTTETGSVYKLGERYHAQ